MNYRSTHFKSEMEPNIISKAMDKYQIQKRVNPNFYYWGMFTNMQKEGLLKEKERLDDEDNPLKMFAKEKAQNLYEMFKNQEGVSRARPPGSCDKCGQCKS